MIEFDQHAATNEGYRIYKIRSSGQVIQSGWAWRARQVACFLKGAKWAWAKASELQVALRDELTTHDYKNAWEALKRENAALDSDLKKMEEERDAWKQGAFENAERVQFWKTKLRQVEDENERLSAHANAMEFSFKKKHEQLTRAQAERDESLAKLNLTPNVYISRDQAGVAMNIPSRFDYVKYDEISAGKQDEFKTACKQVEALIEKLPSGRYKALALTHLEDCYTAIGKAIRDDQISRNGFAELQESRKNG